MSITVTMPEVAETVVEGTIGKWLKKPGDPVERYESIAEIITDKVNIELPSPAAGIMGEILVPEGETVTIGTPIAILITDGEAPAVEVVARAPGLSPAQPAVRPGTLEAAPPPRDKREKRYSPLVLRLAREHGVDLADVRGTGAGGRITKADILRIVDERPSTPAVEEAPAVKDDELAVGPVRQAIAKRMLQSVQQIPHAWTMMEADVSGLVALVKGNKDEFRRREGINLTYLPFVLQAVASALSAYPMVNSVWAEEKIILKKEINLGIAVARDEGLIVPVVQGADRKSVVGLARDIHELAEKARGNKLTPGDVQGGTFTVNNTGALGSVLSAPIINPPQAGIITSEAVVKRPVVVGDAIAIRSIMNICFSFDHRTLDGSQATSFLARVKAGLEAIGPDTSV
ncbi:MAG: 2-oxo acid dehydrogenase subunit E2 [Chloroflexi bacterium]|nr:2-oxo acid dehydrogenase subunit E2 [Chloroflexota bacterium]